MSSESVPLYCLIFTALALTASGQTKGVRTDYEVVFAINAGGEAHVDQHNTEFERDPLMDRIGIASDFGKNLLTIGRIDYMPDEYLYQTERYHTSTFGYDMPLNGDGDYLLQLMFSEVYFKASNMKVFDVVLNQQHTVVPNLDIFHKVRISIKIFYNLLMDCINAQQLTIYSNSITPPVIFIIYKNNVSASVIFAVRSNKLKLRSYYESLKIVFIHFLFNP